MVWSEVRKAVLIKRKAWLTFQASGSRETFERYILARNYSVKMIRAERKNFDVYLGKQLKSNSKTFWSYVNSRTINRVGISSIKNKDKVLTNDTEIAQEFAKKFLVYLCMSQLAQYLFHPPGK